MIRLMKPALALGMISAMALAVATPSEARNGRNAAAIGAGVAGFAVGAAIGSAAAAANNGYYYNEPYAYNQPYGYRSGYTYAPAYEDGYAAGGYYADDSYAYAPGPTRYDRRDPSSYYRPGGNYGPHSTTGWQNRERALNAGD